MLPNPLNHDKYVYVRTTGAFKVRAIYATGIVLWLLVVFGFSGAFFIDPFFTWFVLPLFTVLTIYHLVSFTVNLFYRGFDFRKHAALLHWFDSQRKPSVDVFLPICGEEIAVLRNTWDYVARLNYQNCKVYVLDDSKTDTDLHRREAERRAFVYIERPNKGEMKKAGNLKHAYEHTDGEFIVIFDADFAPHPDFLHDLLPYMVHNPSIGLLQSPQYFDTSTKVHARSALEYGASYTQEDFYRVIQVARGELGAPLCCGSNAIYRRAALNTIGGTVQIEHSEDAHTGFAMLAAGWRVRYLPLVLAVGLCPDNLHAYFLQQHRWASGSMSLMLSAKFWTAKLRWRQKLCFITGFLYYLQHPVSLLFSFQLFWTLFLYNDHISVTNALPFYPYIVFSFLILPFFKIPSLRWGAFYASMVQLYAYSHAVIATFARTSTGWVPTNGKHIKVSAAFRQASTAVAVYTSIYVAFVLLALRTNDLHLLSLNYWSVQFWIFWNLTLSMMLMWQMSSTMRRMKTKNTEAVSEKMAGSAHTLDLRR